MTVWQYLHEVCGLENFISREVPAPIVVAPQPELTQSSPSPARTPKILFLTAETQDAFQKTYATLFTKMMQAMGLTSDTYQLMFAQKTFLSGQEAMQILFDSAQPLGWQTDTSQLVVSSLDDLLSNVDAKRKSWFHLKEVSSRLQ